MDPTAEAALGRNFMAAYMATGSLRRAASKRPDKLDGSCIHVLGAVLDDPAHSDQPLATLLYREAASGLTALMAGGAGPARNRAAHETLMGALRGGSLKSRMAVAEAMGCLPIRLEGTRPEPEDTDAAPRTDLRTFLASRRLEPASAPVRAGRSLVFSLDDPDRLLVVKLARKHDDPADLAMEGAWMRHLGAQTWPCRFDVPEPLGLARLTDAPALAKGFDPREDGFALAYLARKGYFRYPNEPGSLPGPGELAEILGRCARLLGLLASRGILHNAVIPLFHNRTQQARREDSGLYQWHRLGRLDRWLESSRHPNVAPTGLRDFEHFEVRPRSGRGLFHLAGAQVMGLAMVAGSHFRARDPRLKGLDGRGAPADARHLFDRDLLKILLDTVAEQYFTGFCAHAPDRFTLDTGTVAERMIREMGVDTHMTERLRTMDQERMTRKEFTEFLVAGGFAREQAEAQPKDAEEMEVVTGPHLGHFNGKTSLPELNEYAALAAGRAISGLYIHTAE